MISLPRLAWLLLALQLNYADQDDGHSHEENPALFWAALCVSLIVVWAVSLVGSIVPKRIIKQHNRKFIAFCVGTLACSTFFEFLPHAASEVLHFEDREKALRIFSWTVFCGVLAGFAMETAVHLAAGGHTHGHRGCGSDCESVCPPPETAGEKPAARDPRPACRVPPFVLLDLVAKLVHHFVDGALIGSLYAVDLGSGLGVTISVAVHEISVNLGAFSLYVSSGVPKKLSVALCALGSSTILLGGLVTAAIKERLKSSGFLVYITFIALGLFLYLTLADLLPLLLHEEHGVHGREAEVVKSNVVRKSAKERALEVVVLGGCLLAGFVPLFLIITFMGHVH